MYRNAVHDHGPGQHTPKFDEIRKFGEGRVEFELCEWTDRQTNIHAHRNTSHPSRVKGEGGEVNTLVVLVKMAIATISQYHARSRVI